MGQPGTSLHPAVPGAQGRQQLKITCCVTGIYQLFFSFFLGSAKNNKLPFFVNFIIKITKKIIFWLFFLYT